MEPKCTIDQIKDDLSDLQTQLDDIKQSKKDTVVDLQSELDDTTQSKKENVVDNNEEPIEKPVEEKKASSSWRGWIRGTFRIGFKVKKERATYASDSGEGSQSGSRKSKINLDQEDASLEILKLQNDIRQMKAAFENLAHFQSNISKSLRTEVPLNKLKAILLKTDSVKSRARDLKEIRRKVLNLKGQIPSLLKKQSSVGLSITDSQTAEENGQIVETGSDIFLPGLHFSDDFRHSPAFEEVVDKFDDLNKFEEKLCLLSLSVFPENHEFKRTMLMYWWIGEGFISYQDSENTVTRILKEFSGKGLLEEVEDERKLKPSGYKMEPHVHAAVIYLASRMKLFDLYSAGKLKMQNSGKKNVCLVRGSSLQPEAKASKMELETLNSVFNSSERYPDFTFKWFPRMESLKVLYLGRWERTAKRHIEVESTDFLRYLTRLKKLRLASFQGISRIENLRDLTCGLPELVILDLRACYNLEVLPNDIGSLQSLIYLDVSECYMLDRMPQGISRLKKLQVLKGFVISQSDDEKDCAVRDLQNLRKLSITVNRHPFKVEDFMESLKGLTQLESLKIAWGAQFPDEETDEENTQRQQDHATEEKHKDPKEGGDEQVHNKGHEKKANLEESKKNDVVHAESLKSEKVVEGDKGKADQEEGKKQDKVKADSLKSEKKASPSIGEIGTIQSKPEVEEGKSKVAGEADNGKVATEEGQKQDKVDTEKSRSENGVEGVKKASPSSKSIDTVENKPEEKIDGENEKVNPEEGKKKDEVKEVSSKPDDTEVDEKTSSPQESKDTVKSKSDDHQRGDKEEEEKDREKDKTEREKKDEVKAENSEPDKAPEKTSPPKESKDTVKSKPDDQQRGDKQEEEKDREKDKTEGEKKDEVKAENSESDKVTEKKSPLQESKATVKSEPDDQQRGDKQEEEKDKEKDKTEGEKKDEVKAENSEPDKVTEKTSPPQESKDTFTSKPDDQQRGDRPEERRDEEKDKIEEGNKKDEVKTVSLEPEKVDKKTNPTQQSKDKIQSKPDDHEENSKTQEKEDGEKIKAALKKPDGGENTQKLDKNKLRKKVSFSEESRAPVQKKPYDMKKENPEMASTSRSKKTATKKLFTMMRTQTKKLRKARKEDSEIDTSKLPSSLKKLELECYPEKEPPSWLNPKTLDNLEKLSIKGGYLRSFSDKPSTAETKCSVQILRLKYLHKFKAEWKDLQALFPQLKLLEKYKCPEVAFCPTDGNGVWRSQP